jgi:hypothetical protein
MAAAAADPALLDLIPQIHALFADPLRVVSDSGNNPHPD